MKMFENKLKEIRIQYKELGKTFIILCIIFLLGISAIIRANFYYVDDLGRASHGYKSWDFFSRFTSNFLSNFIHADTYLTDVSPLPQFIAVIFLAMAGVIMIYVISGDTKLSIWNIIAVIPIGLSPYFLECLSYKYDAPYMALSILAALVPTLFYRKNYKIYILSIIIGMLLVCTTYQAATGIFPMIIALITFIRWINGKEQIKDLLKFIFVSSGGYIAGILIFRIFIMKPVNSYVGTNTTSLREMPRMIINNFKRYLMLIKTDFKLEWTLLIVILCALFVIVSIINTNRNKFLVLLLSLITNVFMLIMSFGVYPILVNPLFAPRAMYGFGIYIALLNIYIICNSRLCIMKLVPFMISWCFFVFAFTYGNALNVQKEYTDFRIEAVISDLKAQEVLMSKQVKHLQIKGTIGYAPIIKNMPKDYNMLKRLVPIYFKDSSSYWGGYKFMNYYGIRKLKRNTSIDLNPEDLLLLEDTIYHTIYADEKNILIVLK